MDDDTSDQDDDRVDSYGDDRGPDVDDGVLRDRCVLGPAVCCNPHLFHDADECYSAEMAEAFMRAESVRRPRTGRQLTRALWARRGRR